MTLHWWMHWFWVTSHFLVILGNPVPSSTIEPRGQVQDHPTAESTSEIPASIETEGLYRDPNASRQSFRVAKAIGFYPPTNTAAILDRQRATTISGTMERDSTIESSTVAVEQSLPVNNGSSVINLDVAETPAPRRTLDNGEKNRNQMTKKDSKITWISSATNKTVRSKYYEQEEKVEEDRNLGASTDDLEDLTVLPLQEEVSRVRLVLNKTRSSSVSVSSSSVSSSVGKSDVKTFNRSDDDVEIDEEFAEPQLFATAASIVEVGASEATRLSRARSAFPKDFQRDQKIQGSEGHPFDYADSDSNDNSEQASSKSAVDIAAITGSCLATVLLLSTMGSLGFIMYRRRYLNPPQTLNSDKCSNPDSSGYIDDSTIRDNSEEMYSLDNDSFLNSLEAMTIQNYWTDSVKHTKL